MLKENRLVSVISIAGTAISIAMIMVVVLVFQIQFANFYPENNRDRMMYVGCGFLITVIPLLIMGAVARFHYKMNLLSGI